MFSSFAPLSGHFSVSGFPSPGTDRRKLPFVDEQAVRRSGVQGWKPLPRGLGPRRPRLPLSPGPENME